MGVDLFMDIQGVKSEEGNYAHETVNKDAIDMTSSRLNSPISEVSVIHALIRSKDQSR